MRRSRPDDSGTKRASSPQGLNSPSMPLAVDPGVVLEWGLSPLCCVCREAYVPSPGERVEGRNTTASSAGLRRPGGGPGGGGGADESFVVLPDSTPVLSESYFSLSRPGGAAASSPGSGSVAGVATTHTAAHQLSYPGRARIGSRTLSGSCGNSSTVGGTVAPGSELLESGFSSGFGVWTGSVFGVGSSMLESIVQISHAGLSDNVRRESLLHDLARRPSRGNGSAGIVEEGTKRGAGTGVRVGDKGSSSAGQGAVDERPGNGGGHDADDGTDPTLCCHCYASLLERIDEDSRLADGEALAYRDFVELLDGVVAVAADGDLGGDSSLATSSDPAENSTEEENVQVKLAKRNTAFSSTTTTSSDIASPRGGQGTAAAKREATHDAASSKPGVREIGASARVAVSPYAQALQLAQQTSVQLRTELGSLETQREALCARGSTAWAALSELAYARGVLGDECRELLKASREVGKNVGRNLGS